MVNSVLLRKLEGEPFQVEGIELEDGEKNLIIGM